MADKSQCFIKLCHEGIAKALCDGGFSYTTEIVTVVDNTGNRVDKTIYNFVASKKLERAILRLIKSKQYGAVPVIPDLLLRC